MRTTRFLIFSLLLAAAIVGCGKPDVEMPKDPVPPPGHGPTLLPPGATKVETTPGVDK
jgi:hypothetical protein